MTIPQLLEWQWKGYSRYHQDRTNLLVHIVAVPFFMLTTVLLVVALIRLSLSLIVVAIIGMGLALMVQGRGHRREPIPTVPFEGPLNLVGRIFFEQWITFPRFVLSRGWSRNLAAATRGDTGRTPQAGRR
jgi:2-hydroxy-palmitic acid dioxygenase Mpo1-like protein